MRKFEITDDLRQKVFENVCAILDGLNAGRWAQDAQSHGISQSELVAGMIIEMTEQAFTGQWEGKQ